MVLLKEVETRGEEDIGEEQEQRNRVVGKDSGLGIREGDGITLSPLEPYGILVLERIELIPCCYRSPEQDRIRSYSYF